MYMYTTTNIFSISIYRFFYIHIHIKEESNNCIWQMTDTNEKRAYGALHKNEAQRKRAREISNFYKNEVKVFTLYI